MDTAGSVGAGSNARPIWAPAVGWLGIAAHLAIGFFYLASGLVAPPYGVVLLMALWVALLVVGLRLLARRPLWTPVVPGAAVALWAAVVSFGEFVLGWRA